MSEAEMMALAALVNLEAAEIVYEAHNPGMGGFAKSPSAECLDAELRFRGLLPKKEELDASAAVRADQTDEDQV